VTVLLYIAAFLAVAIGLAHSYLGERYLLVRLFRRPDLPKLAGSVEYTIRVMRLAWHITSVAWVGFGAILILLAHPPVTTHNVGLAIGITFLIHGIASLVWGRGKHLSWVIFLAIAALSLYATRT
jgi:hypothetical protein